MVNFAKQLLGNSTRTLYSLSTARREDSLRAQRRVTGDTQRRACVKFSFLRYRTEVVVIVIVVVVVVVYPNYRITTYKIAGEGDTIRVYSLVTITYTPKKVYNAGNLLLAFSSTSNTATTLALSIST